jgi:hypothetical protein
MVTIIRRQANIIEIPFDDANPVYTDEPELSVYGYGITPPYTALRHAS